MPSETNSERVERLLSLEPGAVQAVGVREHVNGVEWSAVMKDGTFTSRVSGRDHWSPPPLKHKVKRAVVGETVVGKRVVGREQVNLDQPGAEPLFRDLVEDVMGPALEGDDTLRARAVEDAQAAAKRAGWRRSTVEDVALGPEGAVVTVSCG